MCLDKVVYLSELVLLKRVMSASLSLFVKSEARPSFKVAPKFSQNLVYFSLSLFKVVLEVSKNFRD